MFIVKNYFLEIKNRFFIISLTFTTSFLFSYNYKEILLFFFLLKPAVDMKFLHEEIYILYFICTNLIEIFLVYFKLIYFITSQIFLFYSIYHFFNFFNFAFYMQEYVFYTKCFKILCITWFFSFILSNYFVVPLSWYFLLNYKIVISSKFVTLHLEPKISEYMSFCVFIYFNCFFYCQFFFLLIIITKHKKINSNKFKKHRKYYYFFLILFFNLIIVIPDIISQILINLIVLVVFEIIILISIFKERSFLRQVIKTN